MLELSQFKHRKIVIVVVFVATFVLAAVCEVFLIVEMDGISVLTSQFATDCYSYGRCRTFEYPTGHEEWYLRRIGPHQANTLVVHSYGSSVHSHPFVCAQSP